MGRGDHRPAARAPARGPPEARVEERTPGDAHRHPRSDPASASARRRGLGAAAALLRSVPRSGRRYPLHRVRGRQGSARRSPGLWRRARTGLRPWRAGHAGHALAVGAHGRCLRRARARGAGRRFGLRLRQYRHAVGHQRMLPEVLAAVVRAMSAARSLAAFEAGAIGPSKDCAYEGPILKAITGCPISMEGKSATCAHFSPLGNIAGAMCDLWSNESVQNIRLLSGSAPEAYTELLAYDCRLMNTAAARGGALTLRDWLVASDEHLSPQAAVRSPAAVPRIAAAIVAEANPYRRTVGAGQTAVSSLNEHREAGTLRLSAKETQWLARIEREFAALPAREDGLAEEMAGRYGRLFDPASYGLASAPTHAGVPSHGR